VTFNGERFDLPILRQHLVDELGRALRVCQHYDILKELSLTLGFKISLSDLAMLNLGTKKDPWDHRRNALIWKEKPHVLRQHNRRDLDLTGFI